jgi:hypothetical protein
MKEKLKKVVELSKKVLKNLMVYSVIVVAAVASFFVGMYYTKMSDKNKTVKYEVNKVLKSEVNLAIDENNHLIVIEKKTGNYTIYQDSIGNTIFNLYAKNVWGQHTQLTTEK